MCGSRDGAEDLFQETFRRVYEKRATIRGENLKPWLYKIATNATIDGLRRPNLMRNISRNKKDDCETDQSLNDIAIEDNSLEPSGNASKREQAEHVRRIIAELPTKQRTTLVLAYYQQLTYTEVADAMGCSVGTVKTQMSRALRTVAKKLPVAFGDQI